MPIRVTKNDEEVEFDTIHVTGRSCLTLLVGILLAIVGMVYLVILFTGAL